MSLEIDPRSKAIDCNGRNVTEEFDTWYDERIADTADCGIALPVTESTVFIWLQGAIARKEMNINTATAGLIRLGLIDTES